MTAGRKETVIEAPENRKLILTSFMYHVYKSQHLSLHKDLKINPSVLRIKGVKLFFFCDSFNSFAKHRQQSDTK